MPTRYVLGFLFIDEPSDSDLLNVVLIHKDAGPPNVAGRWNGHGGEMDDDETPTGAMVRKTREELRVETSPEDWMPFGELRGDGAYGSYVVYLFAGWMPEGQVATQGGREQVGVHVAAECAGQGYVSNVPMLLQAAELALYEPVWLALFAMRDAGAVRKRLEICALLDKPSVFDDSPGPRVPGAGYEVSVPIRPSPLLPAIEPKDGDLWDLRNTIIEGPALRPFAKSFEVNELVGGHFDFGSGIKRPIVATTEGFWSADHVRPPRTLSHIAVLPLGQQPDPNCVLRDEEGNPIAGLGLAGSYPEGFVPPGVETTGQQPDPAGKPWTPDPLDDRSDPEIEPHSIGGGGDCEGIRATEGLQATATPNPPPVFTIDLARYNRSETHPSVPLEDGGEMAVASCWTDWRALATDLALAGMPAALVGAVAGMAQEDFEEEDSEQGVPVQETSPVELELSQIYDRVVAAVVAREFISERREWLDMRLRPDQLTLIEEPSPDEGPFTFTRILGDVRLSTSARGTNMPDLPGIRWAAKGEAAGHENERTVKADWGIAFDGERDALCYVVPNDGPGQVTFEKVQLFWHGGRANRDPIDWPFVEDNADRKHFEALGFKVIWKVE